MAKVNAPLFSFNAAGKLANALVYFGWKGLDCVRSYVIPTNPKSTLQEEQRGFLRAAVLAIHTAQAIADTGLKELDAKAYALWASCFPKPRTWFNQIVKNWLDCAVHALDTLVFYNAVIDATPATGHIEFVIDSQIAPASGVNCYYGTTKTALINKVVATGTPPNYIFDLTPTVKDTKYFFQARVENGEMKYIPRSGIYYAVST